MYITWGSFILLRPKHEIKLPTQSAEKTDLYGEINIRNLGGIVSQKSEGPRQSDFSGDLHDANAPLKKNQQGGSFMDKEIIHILVAKFSIFAKMTTYINVTRSRTPSFCQVNLLYLRQFWSVDDKQWRVGVAISRGVRFWPPGRRQGQLQKISMCKLMSNSLCLASKNSNRIKT